MSESAFLHTQRRVRERYGHHLDRLAYGQLCAVAAAVWADHDDPEPCGEGRYRLTVSWHGRRFRLVFEPASGLIVTALFPRPQPFRRESASGPYATHRKRRDRQPYRRERGCTWEEADD